MSQFYVHHNGASWFVKEAAFFEEQGGLREAWGQRWRLLDASSIEDARVKAERRYPNGDYGLVVHKQSEEKSIMIPATTKVYIVMKNSDFTERGGPMLFHKAFTDGEEAIKYVEAQEGIYGTPQRITRETTGYGFFAYGNGYEIREETLFKTADELLSGVMEVVKANALKRLSTIEKRALGLE